MKIKRAADVPPIAGKDWFTGTVHIHSTFAAEAPGRVSGGAVTFAAGARTNWHTHPLGQTLIVTSGIGRVQRDGGPVEEIGVGDVVWFPAGERHWHGAAPESGMTHIAITEALDGKTVDWMEPVSDDDYAG